MPMVERLVETLDGFLRVTPHVEAAVVASADGFPVVSAVPDYVDERRLAAMSTSVLVLGERAADEMSRGEVRHVFVEGRRGHTIVMPAGDEALLVVTTYPTARIGLVLFEMRRCVRRIVDLMRPEDELTVVRPEAPAAVDLREAPARHPS